MLSQYTSWRETILLSFCFTLHCFYCSHVHPGLHRERGKPQRSSPCWAWIWRTPVRSCTIWRSRERSCPGCNDTRDELTDLELRKGSLKNLCNEIFEVMDIYGDFLPNTEPSLSEPDYSTGLTGALPDPEYLKHNKSQTLANSLTLTNITFTGTESEEKEHCVRWWHQGRTQSEWGLRGKREWGSGRGHWATSTKHYNYATANILRGQYKYNFELCTNIVQCTYKHIHYNLKKIYFLCFFLLHQNQQTGSSILLNIIFSVLVNCNKFTGQMFFLSFTYTELHL